jgi:leader peptidase (prepilin peptidase)/N-methyltransferase
MIEPALFVAAMAILGLMIGSFLNVVIHRLPLMMEREWRAECHGLLETNPDAEEPEVIDLVQPRSRCPSCQGQISAFDNMPVLSFLILRGKCRRCRTPISARYPLVEAFTGGLTAYAAWHFGLGDGVVTGMGLWHSLAASLFIWYLVAMALIDFDTYQLPDSLTLPLLWMGIGCGFFGFLTPDLESSVLGAMFGYLSLWSVYWAFKIVTGKEGMGYGDFKLLAALGAWLGWQSLPALILLSSALGAVVGISLMLRGTIQRSQPMPFGPYLSFAGLIMLFWRDEIAGALAPVGAL